jgi:hypothetical protein
VNLRDLSLIIRDYEHVMTWATPEDADLIDAEFWGSIYFPSHYASAQSVAQRARKAILGRAKEPTVAETDEGADRPKAGSPAKRTKS